MLPLDAKIYLAGHGGLAGSALKRELRSRGYRNIVVRTHLELDLTDQSAVRIFFRQENPQYVLLAAAKVGGILANKNYPAHFVRENLAIQTNVIHEAWRSGVKRLLFLGSSCIYPRECPQPIKESYLLAGPLEFTNRPYAVAKIAGVEMCWSYNRQYGTQFLAAMPTNLYGPGDNYDLDNSHVLPALIRRFHEAKMRSEKVVTLWGSGTPRREFLYSDDMASACVFLLSLEDDVFERIVNSDAQQPQPPLINIGYGEDLTIRELAQAVCKVLGYTGSTNWDHTKPDGAMRKLLNADRIRALGWRPRVGLDQGIRLAYQDFLKSQDKEAT